MHEYIKYLWSKLGDKAGFCERLAEIVGRDGKSLQTHWFSRFLKIPVKFMPIVVEELEREHENILIEIMERRKERSLEEQKP